MSYGIYRHRPLDSYYLRKRLSRKPQTTTAPAPPAGRSQINPLGGPMRMRSPV